MGLLEPHGRHRRRHGQAALGGSTLATTASAPMIRGRFRLREAQSQALPLLPNTLITAEMRDDEDFDDVVIDTVGSGIRKTAQANSPSTLPKHGHRQRKIPHVANGKREVIQELIAQTGLSFFIIGPNAHHVCLGGRRQPNLHFRRRAATAASKSTHATPPASISARR